MTQQTPFFEPDDIVKRLRERRTIKYMADCKCGWCHLVKIDDVCEAGDTIDRLRAINAEMLAALKAIVEGQDYQGFYDAPMSAHLREMGRSAIAKAGGQ